MIQTYTSIKSINYKLLRKNKKYDHTWLVSKIWKIIQININDWICSIPRFLPRLYCKAFPCLDHNTFYEGQLEIEFLKKFSLYTRSHHIHNTTNRQHILNVVIPSLKYLLIRWPRWSSRSVWCLDTTWYPITMWCNSLHKSIVQELTLYDTRLIPKWLSRSLSMTSRSLRWMLEGAYCEGCLWITCKYLTWCIIFSGRYTYIRTWPLSQPSRV